MTIFEVSFCIMPIMYASIRLMRHTQLLFTEWFVSNVKHKPQY